jgi:hypothetical protein
MTAATSNGVAYTNAAVHVDGSDNLVRVARTTRVVREDVNSDVFNEVLMVHLVDTPDKGYLAADEGTGGFGDAECPSSYGMPCITWFGPGERYPDANTALNAVTEDGRTPEEIAASAANDPPATASDDLPERFGIVVNENMHDADLRVVPEDEMGYPFLSGWERIWSGKTFASSLEAKASAEYAEAKEYVRGRMLP